MATVLVMAASPGDIERQEKAGGAVIDKLEPLNGFLKGVERKAFRMAELAVGNPDDALDIVQDAMLGFATRYANKPPSDWPPLFYRVLRSRITDYYRRNAVRRKWLGFLGGDQDGSDPIQRAPDPGGFEPARALGSAQAGEALDQALRDLPRRQREAFMLRVWEGLSVKETAVAMGCSDGSVKTHLSRAVHTLREQLEEYY